MQTPPSLNAHSLPSANVLSSSPLYNINKRPKANSKKSRLDKRAVPAARDAWEYSPHAVPPGGALSSSSTTLVSEKEILTQTQANDRHSTNNHAKLDLPHAPPIIQGIQLVPLQDLPDRLRAVFTYNPFNAIQSRCFPTAFLTDDNLVVSAPTGGGKTVIFELAICRLVSSLQNNQFKIVYMAPTKSLCSERCRDWQKKFAHLNLVCSELTGDTDNAHLRNVQSSDIVITTPEKWDSMTRQWKDHAKLMQLVKLFLIDEVHILRDSRGATLESVVSRMKSVDNSVRFVALSATVPNSEDVATWLGKDQNNPQTPAVREVFGEEFRPVKLSKHIVGLRFKGNDFGFDSAASPR